MFLCFDLETTGLPESRDQFEKTYRNARMKPYMWWKSNLRTNDHFFPHIIQIAFCTSDDSPSLKQEFLIAYAGECHPAALAVHGITLEDRISRGIPLHEALAAFESALDKSKCTHLMGYNLKSFDIPVLLAECVRLENVSLFEKIRNFPVVDVMHLARDAVGERHPEKGYRMAPKLVTLHERLCPGHDFGAHDAMEDVLATLRCYQRLCEIHPHILAYQSTPDMTEEQHRIHDHFIENSDEYRHTLVCAAPGSGKTFLMIHVMKTLITEHDRKASRMVLVTYNRDLAEAYDLEFRKYGILRSGVSFGHRGTLDSLSYRMLGKYRRQSGAADYCQEWSEFWNNCGRELSTEMLRENYTLRKLKQTEFVFVDEYQDMNPAQLTVFASLKVIAPGARWFAAGDVRQSLYLARGADPMAFRSLQPWTFQSLRRTQRCSGPVVRLLNRAFRECEFPAEYQILRNVFQEEILPRNNATTEKDKVIYRHCPDDQDSLLRVLQNHLERLREQHPRDTIGILSPLVHSESSNLILKSIHCLCTHRFGYDQVYMLIADAESRGGRDRVPSHAIHIRSIHTSKGLTYDHVILLMCFENILQNIPQPFRSTRMDTMITFFTGASRARHSLLLVDNRVPGQHRTLNCLYAAQDCLAPESCPLPAQVPLADAESTVRLMSVVDLVREHQWSSDPSNTGGKSRRLLQLVESSERKIILSSARSAIGNHPFWHLPVHLRAQRSQSSFWMLYGTFLENVAAVSLGLPLKIAIWIDQQELNEIKNALRTTVVLGRNGRSALLDPVFARYYLLNLTSREHNEDVLRKIFASHKLVSTSALHIFSQNLAQIHESLRRIRTTDSKNVADLVTDIWRVVRYMGDPDKYVSAPFDLPAESLQPRLGTESQQPAKNFWQVFREDLSAEVSRMFDEGYKMMWQKETRSKSDVILPGPFRPAQAVEVSGRADLVWVRESDVQVWDMKCHSDEEEFKKFPNASWLQVCYYRILFEKKFQRPIRVFLWSLLSRQLYEYSAPSVGPRGGVTNINTPGTGSD
jgi:DNA polymerase III subunit epsilon